MNLRQTHSLQAFNLDSAVERTLAGRVSAACGYRYAGAQHAARNPCSTSRVLSVFTHRVSVIKPLNANNNELLLKIISGQLLGSNIKRGFLRLHPLNIFAQRPSSTYISFRCQFKQA